MKITLKSLKSKKNVVTATKSKIILWLFNFFILFWSPWIRILKHSFFITVNVELNKILVFDKRLESLDKVAKFCLYFNVWTF